jgi:diguanylate cyclase
MSGKAWRIYLAGGLAAVALYFVLPLEGLWSSLAYDLIGLSSVVAILVAVRHLRPARPLIWWCFAAGQLLFVVGDMLYASSTPFCTRAPSPRSPTGSTWAATRS